MLFVLLRTLLAPLSITLLLLQLPLLLVLLCVLPRILREMRHTHATYGLYEQLAAMQLQYQ
jgi:hypothetical protein